MHDILNSFIKTSLLPLLHKKRAFLITTGLPYSFPYFCNIYFYSLILTYSTVSYQCLKPRFGLTQVQSSLTLVQPSPTQVQPSLTLVSPSLTPVSPKFILQRLLTLTHSESITKKLALSRRRVAFRSTLVSSRSTPGPPWFPLDLLQVHLDLIMSLSYQFQLYYIP